MEKNYILFSTNEPKANNNISIIIATDEPITKVSKMLADVCEYSNYTISPVGAPIEGTVYTLEEGITAVKGITLFQDVWTHIKTTTEVVELPDTIVIDTDSDHPSRVTLSLRTTFKANDCAALKEEQEAIQMLMKKFETLAYHKYRNSFTLLAERHEDSKTLRTSIYGVIGGKLIKLTRHFKKTVVAL